MKHRIYKVPVLCVISMKYSGKTETMSENSFAKFYFNFPNEKLEQLFTNPKQKLFTVFYVFFFCVSLFSETELFLQRLPSLYGIVQLIQTQLFDTVLKK